MTPLTAGLPARARFGLLPVEHAGEVPKHPEREEVRDDGADHDDAGEADESPEVEQEGSGRRVAPADDDAAPRDGEAGEPQEDASGVDDSERGVSWRRIGREATSISRVAADLECGSRRPTERSLGDRTRRRRRAG